MLTIYSLEQSEKWDEIVRSFSYFDTYWLSGYVKAFETHGDGEPLLYYYSDGTTRGINVVMKRDLADDERFKGLISHNQYYDFTTPYGYGGWIIEGDNISSLFQEYRDSIEKDGIVSEFVRFHPIIKNHEMCGGFYEVTGLGEVVHMELTSPQEIWNNISSKNRNVIRKAQKNEISIYNGRFPKIFEVFKTIYDSTMSRDNAEDYYYFETSFYESILNDLSHNAQVFWAEKDGKVIAASIFLMANQYMDYHLSGSIKEFGSLAPTNLLLYEAALWGYSNGYKSLYLGGGVGSEEDSLFKFKRAFYRGTLNRFHIGKKIYDEQKYEELINIRGGIKCTFFPQYRG